MRSLRGPIAETIALNAIDFGELGAARTFYEIAADARDPEFTPALAVIEASIGGIAEDDSKLESQLIEVAQAPNPMQERALGELAKEYKDDAAIAYEGFFDDLAGQASRRSQSSARSALAGAEALAAAKRVSEAIAILVGAVKTHESSRPAAHKLAQSILLDALSKDDANLKLAAVDAYVQHIGFFKSQEQNQELQLVIARDLAQIGAAEIVRDILASTNDSVADEANNILALAYLNAGSERAAISIAAGETGKPRRQSDHPQRCVKNRRQRYNTCWRQALDETRRD